MTHGSTNWRNCNFLHLISMKLNGNILRGDRAQQAFESVLFSWKHRLFNVNWYGRLLISVHWCFKSNCIPWLLVVGLKRNPLKLTGFCVITLASISIFLETEMIRFLLLQGSNWAMAMNSVLLCCGVSGCISGSDAMCLSHAIAVNGSEQLEEKLTVTSL